jgi:hypothetical protein
MLFFNPAGLLQQAAHYKNPSLAFVKSIKSFLGKYGIHSFLLPLFAILHSYRQYYGLVDVDVTAKTFGLLILIFLVSFLLVLAIIRNVNKSLQLITLFGLVYLFYGAIKDFFQLTLHASFLAKYSVLLPAMGITLVILTRAILKKKEFRKTNLFQNLLLITFILIDVTALIVFDSSYFLRKNLLAKNSRLNLDSLRSIHQTLDVYFLVLDSYPGTTFLKDNMQYDNSLFNKALQNKGFRVLANPESNYHRSAFSIAATLNFEYLSKVKSSQPISPKEYTEATLTVEHALVPQVFKHYNYTLFNLSIFDIDDTRSLHPEDFLTLPQRDVLLYNTLSERLRRDLLWNFVTGRYAVSFIQRMEQRRQEKLAREQIKKRDFNNIVIDSLMKIPLQKTNSPKFVYAHVYLPHPPFFYDENGSENDLKTVLDEKSHEDRLLFLSYLKYTNNVTTKIIDGIMQSTGGHAVIILQSDHGFRNFEGAASHPRTFFQNYSAFYFPDKNYSALYDTMSNINTFPVIFNKYFGTNIPLQQDTTVFLTP